MSFQRNFRVKMLVFQNEMSHEMEQKKLYKIKGFFFFYYLFFENKTILNFKNYIFKLRKKNQIERGGFREEFKEWMFCKGGKERKEVLNATKYFF